jgi:hypothetical protein
VQVIPTARTVRYEQLEPGELFLFTDEGTYALKCRQEKDERNKMVLLGPSFMDGGGSHLLAWQAITVLSFGKDFTIFLPTEPHAWVSQPLDHSQVWLAVAEDRTFVCTNVGPSPQHPVRGFVDLGTGEIAERRIQGSALFTNSWEIVVLGTNHPPRTILKYPLPEAE